MINKIKTCPPTPLFCSQNDEKLKNLVCVLILLYLLPCTSTPLLEGLVTNGHFVVHHNHSGVQWCTQVYKSGGYNKQKIWYEMSVCTFLRIFCFAWWLIVVTTWAEWWLVPTTADHCGHIPGSSYGNKAMWLNDKTAACQLGVFYQTEMEL